MRQTHSISFLTPENTNEGLDSPGKEGQLPSFGGIQVSRRGSGAGAALSIREGSAVNFEEVERIEILLNMY